VTGKFYLLLGDMSRKKKKGKLRGAEVRDMDGSLGGKFLPIQASEGF
jgi:hypothetical protein